MVKKIFDPSVARQGAINELSNLILDTLKSKGDVSKKLETRIRSRTDLGKLRTFVALAITSKTVEEFEIGLLRKNN